LNIVQSIIVGHCVSIISSIYEQICYTWYDEERRRRRRRKRSKDNHFFR